MPSHKHIFKKYLNKYFVETGTFKGEGLDIALDCGFEYVDSIEIFEEFFIKAKNKFKNNLNVKLYLGKSEDTLWDVIKNKNDKITFWLDGHYMGPISDVYQETFLKTGSPMSDIKTPILHELEIISKHHIKDHTIMIDDMRCCDTDLFDFISKKQIEECVLKINPNYKIYYENSWEPNDILIAKV
jgi:hypothetical protein